MKNFVLGTSAYKCALADNEITWQEQGQRKRWWKIEIRLQTLVLVLPKTYEIRSSQVARGKTTRNCAKSTAELKRHCEKRCTMLSIKYAWKRPKHVVRKTLETSTESRLESYSMCTSAVRTTIFSNNDQSDIFPVTCFQCFWSQILQHPCILL